MRSPVAALLVTVVLVAACSASASPSPTGSPSGAGGPSVFPVIISSEQAVGTNRFVFSFVDAQSARVASPDRTVSIEAYPTAGGSASPNAVNADATFLWAIPDSIGDYRATLEFREAGQWTMIFTTALAGGTPERIAFSLDVKQDPSAVWVSEPAPSVTTPTLDDVDGDLARISSDADPEPRFYEVSVDEALAAGEPFILVFATPKFCASATCGPMLENVKSVAADFPGVRVINVEPYELTYTNGALVPVLTDGLPTPVPAVRSYGLLSEPFVYAIDAEGRVTASFEAVVDDVELRDAFEGLQGASG
jgi:hypothetical protein